jgi:hypothetical protein
MPNLNGTGPKGQGAMSGRKKGHCKNTKTTQTEKPEIQSAENKKVDGGGKGKGQGKGRGRGPGSRN